VAGNIKNLRSLGTLTTEEARAISSRGGIASGQSRRRRKMIRELMGNAMTARVTDGDVEAWLIEAGYEPTFENAMTLSVLTKAAQGDVEAARFVRDTLGEKPTETFNLAVSDKPVKAVDLSGMTDAEIEALADRADDVPAALPEAAEN